MLLALVSPVLAGLLVNEVVYDPTGADDGLEWVELCNNGEETLDLAGYTFENAGGTYASVYTFASGTIAPGEYLLVGGASTTHAGSFRENLQNGGTETDGLRIKDAAGTVIDTVLYDEPNTVLAEDDGTVPTTGAPAASSGKSIGRFPDCADTNVSESDFVLYDAPSPLAVNEDPNEGGGDTGTVTTVDCAGADGIVINELMANPDGSDSGLEWLEVKNTGAAAVMLDGWTVEWDTSSFTGASSWAFPVATPIAPGEYVVVGAGGLAASLSLGNAGSNADGVRIVCDGAPVDTVVYGASNTDNFLDDTGLVALSLAPKPTEGDSIQRSPDGLDTDVCGVDFVSGPPSPGAENSSIGPVGDADCTGSDGVVINELVYSTDAEWIELYNAGGAAVLLDGWVIEFGTSSYNKDEALPLGTALAPGEWIVIGSAGALDKDIELDLDFGNASSTDAVRLTCNTLPVDTVVYGDPNTDLWTDDSGLVATSLAPDHGTGESIARVSDGYDTDACGSDFTASATPSPGEANPVVEPPVCEIAGADGLKVNEFIYNPDGTDTGNEWVELYNAGSDEIRLDDYVIQTAGTDWGEDFRFPGGVFLAPGEFMLLGGETVADVDYLAPDLSLENSSSGAAGIRVVDCEGNVLDSVLYGDTEIEDPITGDNGSLEVVPDVSESVSVGRFPDGEDSDAAADWIPYAAPSPGSANADPGAIGDDTGVQGPGPGCGNKGGAPAPGGCNTVLPFGGFEVGLAALAMLRRRRA
ncbi:MAG: lamin tail domain-containing protein [Pseudomonadota bacterium]|nr:lamin tail domain-containing protein [Pseudomonadota bacterium]